MLQKFKPKFFQEIPFDTMQGRSLLFSVTELNGQELIVATSHFESLPQSFKIREKQFIKTYEVLKDYANVIIMGDFNFDLECDERNITAEYEDIWAQLKPLEKGHTWFMGNYSHRLDRVIVKKK